MIAGSDPQGGVAAQPFQRRRVALDREDSRPRPSVGDRERDRTRTAAEVDRDRSGR
jgi:hypothetical protein